MTSQDPRPLIDKLRALGVKVGAQDLPAPLPKRPPLLEQTLSGHPLETTQGETFVVDSYFEADYQHGYAQLLPARASPTLAAWAGNLRLEEQEPESYAFVDCETTGLSGGTGTFAFLIGVGRFENSIFHLAQFFMRDPFEEPAQLNALEHFLAPCQTIVTFNGKAFDAPLLNTRFLVHGLRSPLLEMGHVDLLHLSRRLWRDRLPSRTLINLEVQILGASRTQDDIPGWMIPQIYFDYLRSGDPQPLQNVFYHNSMDIISLAALFNHISALLSAPNFDTLQFGVDKISLARLLEDLGDEENAIRLYSQGLELNHEAFSGSVSPDTLSADIFLQAIQRLALIYKRQQKHTLAVQIWERAVLQEDIFAHIELAKYYEHRRKDYPTAYRYTLSALEIINKPTKPRAERLRWQAELEIRRDRLMRKLSRDALK